MKNLTWTLALALALGFGACKGSGDEKKEQTNPEEQTKKMELLERAKLYFKPLPAVALAEHNEITEEKVKLGKILYFDNKLSETGNISCNSCHDLNTFGVDNLPVSPGDDGTLGTRNSPTVFNAAFHTTQFWDGRAKDVEEQAGMPITNPVEMMMVDEDYTVNRLKTSNAYADLFKAAFPNDADPVSFENLKLAIGAFERTLVTPSKFDEFLNGNIDAMSLEELSGMETFITTGCIACHKGEVLGGGALQKFPLFGSYEEFTGATVVDYGKYEETKVESDKHLFKPQSLRNVEKTYPYMHDGKVESLEEAVRIMGLTSLNKTLSDKEIASIVTFLKTLTADIPEDVKQAPDELLTIWQ